MQRNVTKEIDPIFFAGVAHSRLGAENMSALLAVWTCKEGHILDHTQNRDVRFLKHVDTLDSVFEGDVLWCGYNKST